MDPTTTTEVAQNFVDVYAGKSIVQIIVDSLSGLASGITTSISDAFNGLVLTSDGKLSALAIWTLSMFGIGFIWKIVPTAVRLFKSRR